MTAHCRPDRYPDKADIDEAAAFIALAIDDRVPYTRAIIRIAERIHELRESASSPPLPRPPPATGEGEPPPGRPFYQEGDRIMRRDR
jgi:hypothetical protein